MEERKEARVVHLGPSQVWLCAVSGRKRVTGSEDGLEGTAEEQDEEEEEGLGHLGSLPQELSVRQVLWS